MELLQNAVALAAKIQSITAEVLAVNIGRNDIVKATWLSLISGRPAFFLGAPGVNKTGTVQAMARRIEGCLFYDALMPMIVSVEQLLVESTSIEEVPGPNGGRSIRTKDTLGRAALAHILFADEIWKSDPRVLNTTLDLAKGDGVRHEGEMVKTPLLSFLAASNELPDVEGNLGAAWSRMTIRVVVNPLDRSGKAQLVTARLRRQRSTGSSALAALTLSEIQILRKARSHVEVSDDIVNTTLDIYEALVNEVAADFKWVWDDDRRFGRCFDIMQANALMEGRVKVGKQDLVVLEWLLWDQPEHIPAVKAKLAPYVRTPLTDAQELLDALLSPTGVVETVRGGNRIKGVEALTQCESTEVELKRLEGEAGDDTMKRAIDGLRNQLDLVKQDVIAVVTGARTINAASSAAGGA